jgi:MYXO-CTERM domain-containing protein
MTSLMRLGMRTLMTSAALAAFSPPLFAQSECNSDADCDKGFNCEVTAVSGCAAPACPPDGDCPEPMPCEAAEYKSCVAGPCEADADCADGMVCHKETVEQCSISSCAGTDCMEMRECTKEEIAQCVPKWALPCESAMDCGEGFECVAQEACNCADTATPPPMAEPGPAPAQDAGASGAAVAPVPLPPEEIPTTEPMERPVECTCAPAASRCQAIVTECTADADCPSDWTCEALAQPTCGGPTEPTPVSGGASGAAAPPADLVAPAPSAEMMPDPIVPKPAPADAGAPMPCDLAPVKSVCQPPYGDVVVTPGLPSMGETPVEVTDPAPPPVPMQPASSSTTTDVATPPDGPGTPVATATPGGENPMTETPTDENHNVGVVDSDTDESGGGCSVATGAKSTSNGLWLVAAGLGALFSRRRNLRG